MQLKYGTDHTLNLHIQHLDERDGNLQRHVLLYATYTLRLRMLKVSEFLGILPRSLVTQLSPSQFSFSPNIRSNYMSQLHEMRAVL